MLTQQWDDNHTTAIEATYKARQAWGEELTEMDCRTRPYLHGLVHLAFLENAMDGRTLGLPDHAPWIKGNNS